MGDQLLVNKKECEDMRYTKPLLIISLVLMTVVSNAPVWSAENGGIANLRQTGKAFSSVAKKVSPSVVFVKVESVQKNSPITSFSSPFNDDFFNDFLANLFQDFLSHKRHRVSVRF